SSARQHPRQDGARMTAAAEGAIDGDVTGRRPKAVQHFGHHDRPVHPGGRLARRQDLLDVRGVAPRVEFLVLLVEMARVLALIPRSPSPHWLGHQSIIANLEKSLMKPRHTRV